MDALSNKFLNQKVKVTIRDGRIFYGIIKSVDIKGNLILNEVIVELPAHKISPLNKHIEYLFDFAENKEQALQLYFDVNEETPKENIERLWENRFYISGFVVPFDIIDSILAMN